MRGDDLYAWQEQEPDGSWGIIAAVIPGLGMGPLVMRDTVAALRLEYLAEAHAQASGHKVRLARFTLTEAQALR